MDQTLPQNAWQEPRGFNRSDWFLAIALTAAVFLTYLPVWQGGLIWDDDRHVTQPELRSWQGLYRIWFDVGATQQYYPLTHSVFWLEHKLWSDATLGYHLVNLFLHSTAAILVALVLLRLAIPGAWLAAAVFALHPVHVESVAWIAELKNTLSAVFYMGAMLAYLKFDRTRHRANYCLALGLFLMALLSKTVTCTLPAALLVIFWWQRGSLSWKKDVWSLVPLFLLGVVAGLFTPWVERELLRAQGNEYQFTVVERFLIAGQAVWFYLGKLLWPADLIFIYPRWSVSQAEWWQYLYPLAAVALLAAAWMLRKRGRGALAALLFFGGTLFPALGFFNVYPFRYSLVADHFQYLASLGPIVLTAAVATILATRRSWIKPAGYALSLVLLATLSVLTWSQSRNYSDIKTLFQATIKADPDCWMAYNNLGAELTKDRKYVEAKKYFLKARELNSNDPDIRSNYGTALEREKKYDEAYDEYQQALKINPECLLAHQNIANFLLRRNQFDEAAFHFRKVLKLRTDLKLTPDSEVHSNLAVALAQEGHFDEAVAHLQQAVRIKPDYAEARNNFGTVLRRQGNLSAAITEYRRALEIRSDYSEAEYNLEDALSKQQTMLEEFARRREAVRARPEDVVLLNDLAWDLATHPDDSVRNGAEAVELARRAVKISGGRDPALFGTLAAAFAETGRFQQAVQTAREALNLLGQQDQSVRAASIAAQIRLYEARTPYRQLPLVAPRQAPHP